MIDAQLVRKEWRACRAMLMLPVQQRRTQGSLWLSWCLLALAVLGAGTGWLVRHHPDAAIIFATSAGLPLGILLCMWWSALLHQLLPLMRGTGRLVPGMGARALGIAVAATLLVALSMTAVVGIPLGRPGWVFACSALLLVEMAAGMTRSWRIVLWIIVGPVLAIALHFFGIDLPPSLDRFLGSDAAILPFLMVAGLDGWLSVRAAKAPERERTPGGFANSLSPRDAAAPCRRPSASQGLIDVLNLGSVQSVLSSALVAALIPVWMLYGNRDIDSDNMALGRFATAACLLMVLALAACGCAQGLYKTRLEQGLLRLAPGVPRLDGLNRMLARELMARVLGWSAGIAAISLGVLLLTGASRDETARAMVLFTLSPVICGYVLRDFSRDQTPTMSGLLGYFAVLAIVDLVLMRALDLALLGELAIIAGINVAAGAAFAWHRWQAMCAAPIAFPAGRFAR